MKRTLPFLAILACCVPVAAQKAKVERDPELKDKLGEYRSILKAKDNRTGSRDGEAIEGMNVLLRGYDKMHVKDKLAVTKGLAETFRLARRTQGNAGLYHRAVANLGLTGKQGAAHLRKLFTLKHISKGKGRKGWYKLRVQVIRSLGKCKDQGSIEFLLETMTRNAESDLFLAAAGEALGEYEDSADATRKHIAKPMIRELNRLYNLSNKPGRRDPYDIQTPTYERRYRAVRLPWGKTLRRLTRQEFTKPGEWQRFWNKNKSKPWNKPAKTPEKKKRTR